MNARLLFILLAIALTLAFTQRYRKLGFGLSAVLLLLLVWFIVHQPQPVTEPTAPTSSSATAPRLTTQVQLQNLTLEGDGAPWHLSGSVLNVSAMTIKTVEVQIERRDCPDIASPINDCQVLWQGQYIVRSTLSPAAKVSLDERFYSHESPARPRGVARDQFTITAVH